MFHTSRTNRAASILGAGILGLLVLAGSIAAVGNDVQRDTDGVDIGYAKHGNVAVQTADPRNGPANWRRLLNEIDSPLPRAESREITSSERLDACVFDQRYLPRTADAIDGWYLNCRIHN